MSDLASRLGGLLRAEQDRTLGKRAVRAGLVSEKDLEGVANVEAYLRGRGATDEQIRALKHEIDREEYALFRPDRRPPPEVEDLQGDPDRRFAEFVLVKQLGAGGLGEVWKAWDGRLGRWVAIKLPAQGPGDESTARRFTREALAAARLSHPNIVGIHRVAEERGRPFIVMQYIDGQTLHRARPPLRRAVEILRDVAFAVHYAHEQGVVHRDVKPGNIMIAADGRPFILDFGLAHLEDAGRQATREGLVAGTASFMSPEQARGDAAARQPASDVYALGATLYDAVTGRPPFQGATFAETLEKVLRQELLSPRTVEPSIPTAVEHVILKAMDRDPARRYPSARAFAEDLDAWLHDRPIAARRGAVTRALRRRIRRNPQLVAVLGLLLLVAVGVAGVVGMDAQRERRALEARVRAARDVMKVSVQALLELRRAAANDRMSDFLPDIEAAHGSGPASADLDYLLGRAYRIVLDEARALQLQEAALAKEPDHPAARYEAALLRSRRGLPPGKVDGLPEANRLVLQGGTEALAKAVELNPRLEEAWEGLGLAWLAAAKPMDAPGVQDAALARAEAAFTEGASHDRGYAPHYLGRGRVRTARAQLLQETGRDPSPIFETAEDDFKAAILMGGPVFTARAELRLRRGLYRAALGGNPKPHFDEALADLEEALKRAPDDARALALRARVRVAEAETGGDPLEAFRLGEPDAAAAGPAAWGIRGELWALRAAARAQRGEGAGEDFMRADGFLADALRERPGDPVLLERRAWARLLRARAAGGNVLNLLASAEADLEKAVAATVFFPRARLTRAALRRLKAVALEKPDAPAIETLRSAAEDLMWVLGTNPLSFEAWVERGYVELEAGRQRTRAGDRFGAREPFTQAVRSFEEAVRINGRLAAELREPLREARRALLP